MELEWKIEKEKKKRRERERKREKKILLLPNIQWFHLWIEVTTNDLFEAKMTNCTILSLNQNSISSPMAIVSWFNILIYVHARCHVEMSIHLIVFRVKEKWQLEQIHD